MNLLLVSDIFPFPPEKNGNTENVYNLIIRLKKDYNYNIDFLYIGDLESLIQNRVDELGKIVNNLVLKHLGNSKFIRLSRWIFPKNFGLVSNYNVIFFATFLSAYTRYNFDHKTKHILYQADSRTLKYLKKKGIVNKIRYAKYKFEQKLLFRNFDLVIFVSDQDEAEVNSYLHQKTKTSTIPIGCNVDKEIKILDSIEKPIDLIFTGNFHFPPNSEAASFFMKNIASKLISRNPGIKIYFVGRYPTDEMVALARNFQDSVVITGEVHSISDYLKQSKVYISPLFNGSGMKNKMLQAMAHALPIVGSIESISGFSERGNFLIAETEDDWIENIELLINSVSERQRIGMNNLQVLLEKYTFDEIVKNHFHPTFMNIL